MRFLCLAIFYTLIAHIHLSAQNSNDIILPSFDDKYSTYVRQLESGKTDIDYQDFRFSLLESEQFKIIGLKRSYIDSLINAMYDNMNKSQYDTIISITKKILSVDYTRMLAHKILRQTYKVLGDTVNANKYKSIQFGLLHSIVDNGDGKTCATGWPVIYISEEYFILSMIDAELIKQRLDNDDGIHLCDEMEVTIEGKQKTYYFDVRKIFEYHNKLKREYLLKK